MPAEKRAIVMVSIGDRPWSSEACRTFEHYAEVIGADVHLVTEYPTAAEFPFPADLPDSPGRKNKLASAAKTYFGWRYLALEGYDRVLLLDDTCCVRVTAPDIFAHVEVGRCGYTGTSANHAASSFEVISKFLASRGLPDIEYNPQHYPNGGVMVYDRAMQEALHPDIICDSVPLLFARYPNQTLTYYLLKRGGVQLRRMPKAFNSIPGMSLAKDVRRELTDISGHLSPSIHITHVTGAFRLRGQIVTQIAEIFLREWENRPASADIAPARFEPENLEDESESEPESEPPPGAEAAPAASDPEPVEEAPAAPPVPREPGALSAAPEGQRKSLFFDLLGARVAAADALLSGAAEQLAAIDQAIADVAPQAPSEAATPLVPERVQAGTAELHAKVNDLRGGVAALARAAANARQAAGLAPAKVPRPRRPPLGPEVREGLGALAQSAFERFGFEAALQFSLINARAEDASLILERLAEAIPAGDDRSLRALWAAYAVSPGSEQAARLAGKMFRRGDLSGASALGELANAATEQMIEAAELRQYLASPQLPPRHGESPSTAPVLDVAYVAASSLPYSVTGYAVRTQQLLAALTAQGLRTVCYTRPGYPWDRPELLTDSRIVEEAHTEDSVAYRHLSLASAEAEESGFLNRNSSLLEAEFRAAPPAVVHAASNNRNALPALLAARRLGLPFIYEVRGLWELTAASKVEGWDKTERFELDRRLETHVATEADHVLVITQGVADELVSSGVDPARISLLPNGVDPSAFPPGPADPALAQAVGISASDFVVAYAGTLTLYEGLDDLIRAAALLRGRGVPALVLLVGDGPMRPGLEVLAEQLGALDYVRFVGPVEPTKVVDYLRLADVVAIPRKPFRVCEVVSPLKPFEAMALGKPLVLSDLAALREIVSDGETGRLCRPADPDHIAEVLAELAADPEQRERLARAARAWVIEHRSWSAHAERVQALYARLKAAGPVSAAP